MKAHRTTRGQISLIGIIILSLVISVLMLGYYALFKLALFIFNPLYSVYIATGIYALLALALGIYRYYYGAIIPRDYITSDDTLPEVPDYDIEQDTETPNETDDTTDQTDEDQSLISKLFNRTTNSKSKTQQTTQNGKPPDIPRDLYMKTIAKDSYTLEDARTDAQERSDDPKD